MSYQIALNFEDGVTRFIECRPNEVVADASYRQRINIPLDCRDGACGTCKSLLRVRQYDGGDYIDEAMTEDEAEQGYVLTCQMVPESDCIIRIPATSDVAKTSISTYAGELASIDRLSDTAIAFSIKLDDRSSLGFLPGQYVNIQVPGTDQARSFSFSSGPGADEVGFLIRNTTHGVLTTYLRDRAKIGDRIEFNGPLGSFYLREIKRPVLFLAGGTGPRAVPVDAAQDRAGRRQRAPDPPDLRRDQRRRTWSRWTSWRATPRGCRTSPSPAGGGGGEQLPEQGLRHPPHEARAPATTGSSTSTSAVRRRWSTRCASTWPTRASTPASFYYEKFSGSRRGQRDRRVARQGRRLRRGVRRPDGARTGGGPAGVGKLSAEQLAEYRRLAEATGEHIKDGHFTDPAGFREANSAFHLFPIEATGNAILLEAYRKLLVQEYMGQVLTPSVDVVGDITQDHIDIVDAFESGDIEALRRIIVEHTDHAKATMRAGIEKPGSAG